MAQQQEVVRFEAQHAAMGTMYSIMAYAPPSVSLPDAVQRAFEEIDRLESLMSYHRPTSEICAVNHGAFKAPVQVAPELLALLEEAIGLSEQTGGAFDVTVGPLMKAWGFFRRQGCLPGEAKLAEALKRTGYRHISLDRKARTVGFDQEGMEIDLGAIGKGYAVDRVVDVLLAHGVRSALISSGGSSIAALGAPPGELGWEISLRDPFDPRIEARTLRLRNLSISISGGCEQMFVLDGKAYTHLIDPRNGQPAEGVVMTAVIGRSNALIDALSTAFFVLGAEGTREFLGCHEGITTIWFSLSGTVGAISQTMLASSNLVLPENCLLEFGDA